MKKWLTTFICGLGIQTLIFAQGSVNWGFINPLAVTAQTNTYFFSGDTQGSASLGTGYYFELLIGSVWDGTYQAPPTTLAQLAAWTDSGLEASNSPTPGRLSAMNPNTSATVNALSTTVSNNIVLVGWSANLGSTWSSAYVNMQSFNYTGPVYFGSSVTGYIEGFSPGFPGVNLFGSSAIPQGVPIYSPNTQLYLIAIPEPGTVALAILGSTLFLSRALKRRKAMRD